MAEQDTRRTNPYLPTKNWWDLRRKFAQGMPRQVTGDYLQSVLGLSEGSAKNLVPSLKLLGLIDDTGKPTDLANDWRTDEHYAEVCERMREAGYPSTLRDALPPPSPDKDATDRWFLRNTGTGQRSAQRMAGFYRLLCQADVSMQDQAADRTSRRNGAEAGAKTGRSRVRALKRDANPEATTAGQVPARVDPPTLHLTVQIHISADASAELIEQVFANMAKHLYRQE